MLLDLLLVNAAARTLDPRRPHATRIGVLHGRVVGLDDDLDGLAAEHTVDLRGRTVLPGFVDAHNHLAWAGLAERAVDLTGTADPAAALDRIARAAELAAPDGWVDVVGYDQRPFGRHLTRDDLDSVAGGRKVYAIHTSGHAHLVSSAVLDLLPSLPAADPDVVTDATGRPTGLFLEAATALVAAVRAPYPVAELADAISVAAARCAAQGITTVAEAGVGGGLTGRSPVEVLAYQQAIEAGRFPLRAQVMVTVDALSEITAHPADGVGWAFPLGLRTGFGSDRLALGAVKAWLDGGMMARTAALSAPYADAGPPRSGGLTPDLERVKEVACAAHAAGWQLALHAIGDRAVDAALDIVEAAQRRQPRPAARHRIEHCGLVRPDQLPRLAAARVTAVVQPAFLHAFGDDYATIMGPGRADWLYRGRAFLDHGIPLAGSSDRPVADGAPLRAIQFMVERRSHTGAVIGPSEALHVTEALHAYTMGSAAACGMADRIGSITVGKHADLVVLDADPARVPPHEIADIPVLATAVGGTIIHGSWPA